LVLGAIATRLPAMVGAGSLMRIKGRQTLHRWIWRSAERIPWSRSNAAL